ncbi:phospholipase D-like domain-containing protein [Mycolicibacterium sp. F2034L]|uniref:phospholipase D-like domain-containing protein n=1 Tax=Mycolicibacterium sp. F2034L TaxID=2926422 RepID=UPI001FF3E170|nr:phospholipase D-like domain-containing protein [Mycolicibacterium sp. F2034L]MCK0176986.1 phospholipase D-like domain-containing protein [Mycolicibacterium sp. F2034L]
MSAGDGYLLVPGQTCWRVEHADRYACVIDGADYFHHVKSAMLRAHRRIVLIGWDFDTRMLFEPADKTTRGPNQLGMFLRWLVRVRRDLDVYLLRSNLRLVPALQGIWGQMTPVALLNWLSSERLHFAIDGAHPTGSVHHQKIVVIDDAVAFCGGIDLSLDRWDTPAHEERNRFRRNAGRSYGPRHDVVVAVDGAAARTLGEQARDRWRTATGQALEPIEEGRDAWPRGLEPTLRDLDVGIARTLPELGPREEVREIEAMNLAAIASAREVIYLENQYLASRDIADALCARLHEDDGPQIVVVMPRSSESRLEQQAMDSARYRLLQKLWAADQYDRMGVYWPVAEAGTPIYVHSKVMVIDDGLLRVGSSNLNNRSMGFDSECDVIVEADRADDGVAIRTAVASIRNRLIAEHLGVPPDEFERVMGELGGYLEAIEALRSEADGKTLRRFTEETVAGEASVLAENDLMDPDRVPQSLSQSVQRWIAGLTDRP